jgi:hypothetical protein
MHKRIKTKDGLLLTLTAGAAITCAQTTSAGMFRGPVRRSDCASTAQALEQPIVRNQEN